ncbi:MAG: ABC transporter ATP-binding protein [Planctomycetes bacterium]|nr:ABC transporter ATP-binding protein [Planctomycetota bacterium]
MATSVLELNQLTVKYGSFTALNSVSAAFEGGGLGLLGPNGAGKSSMLRCILGLIQPAGGEVRIFGEVSSDQRNSLLRRRIGYMPERDTWVPGMSAVRGLAHLAEICGFLPADAMLRASDVLYFVGLGEERYREVHTFSTGMRQRYKLAAALVHDPDLLFLDEPTNGLDPRGRARMLELIDQVRRDHGIHLILASHLLPDVEYLCEHVWVLDKGEMKMSNSVADLTAVARGAKRVRVEESQLAHFKQAATGAGLTVLQGRSATEVLLDSPSGVLASQSIFELGRSCQVQIQSVQPAAKSLEDAFLEALEGDNPSELPEGIA